MTTRRTNAQRLADCERRYRDLARQLADIGLIHHGSLVHRYTHCANPNCRCRADPARPHGPYWQWTAKVADKTVTRRLTDHEAALYQEWIANDRHLRQLITQMRRIAEQATQLILRGNDPTPHAAHSRPTKHGETPDAIT